MGRIAAVLLLMSLPLVALGQDQTTANPDGTTATPSEPATAAVTKDPVGLATAQRSLVAMGGLAQVLQDSLTTGTLKLPGDKPKTFSVTIKTLGTRRTRVELSNADGTRVRILNQGEAAIQYPDGKVRKLLMNNTLPERVSHIPSLSLLVESNDPSVIAEYLGPAQVAGGATADVVALRPVPIPGMSQKDLDATTTKTLFYVDQQSGLVTKVEYSLFAENDPDAKAKLETYFSDFRSVNGVWVPFHQMTYEDGKLTGDLVLDSVAFNVGISGTEFDLPKEVANVQ